MTITLRGTLSDLKRRPSCRWALRRALRHADAVVSVSRSLRDDAVELGISADRIDVIPNGIDADLFAPMARQQAREQLGLPSNARVLLTVGALRHVKGHDLLLRAFARLCFGDGTRSNGVAGAPGSGDQVGGGTTTPEGLPERGQKLRLVVLGGRSHFRTIVARVARPGSRAGFGRPRSLGGGSRAFGGPTLACRCRCFHARLAPRGLLQRRARGARLRSPGRGDSGRR